MRKSLGASSFVAALALSLTANASELQDKTLTEILSDSRAVVHGRVIDQFSQWEQIDGNNIIFTYSIIEVDNAQFHRMHSTPEVVVRTVGGTVNGYSQLLIDEASFKVGEEVVAFLTLEQDWLHLSVTNFRQGKYTVVRGENGRIRGLRPDLGQQVHVEKQKEQALISPARFAADFRQAHSKLAGGDISKINPLTRVR